jgi:hypothetical protein
MGFQDNWLITPEQLRDETPSRFDGLSYEQEMHLRTQACFHIDRLRNCRRPSETTLDFIKQHVVSTAKLLLHRFYTQHSFKTHQYEDVALAALFLAAKVEDRPIKVVTLLNKYFLLQDPQHQDFLEKSRDQECVRACARACVRVRVRVRMRDGRSPCMRDGRSPCMRDGRSPCMRDGRSPCRATPRVCA